MDRRMAAINPDAADKWQADKTAEALTTPAIPPEPVEFTGERKSRTAFLGIAEDIREESDRDAVKRDEFARKVWDQI